jgi:septum site-determining protein MinD
MKGQDMGTVTVITSGKGGVGKSTVTVGLGAALARNQKKVLLIDVDAGLSSLDFLLDIGDKLVYNIFDIVNGNCDFLKAIYRSKCNEGLFLLPAPTDAKNEVGPDTMKQLVELLSPYYHHILIDSPAGLSRGFEAAVAAADRVLILATLDPICLRAAKAVLKRLIKSKKFEIRLVLNKFSKSLFKKIKVYRDLDAVIDEVGIQLLGMVPEDREITTAMAKGSTNFGKKSSRVFDRICSRFLGEQKFLSI